MEVKQELVYIFPGEYKIEIEEHFFLNETVIENEFDSIKQKKDDGNIPTELPQTIINPKSETVDDADIKYNLAETNDFQPPLKGAPEEQNNKRQWVLPKNPTNEKSFKCELCSKLFATKYRRMHMRCHTGEKPFKCEICLESFTTNFQVNIHVMRCHTGEIPFKCEVVTVDNRSIWQSSWVSDVYAVMAGTSDEYFTMQESGVPVSASGKDEKAGSQASLSNDCSSSVVGSLAIGGYTVTGSKLSDKITKTLKESRQKSTKRTAELSSEELEKRKKKRSLFMKNYRAKHSKEAREVRLQQVRQHAAEIRNSESEQAKKARLKKMRQRAAKNLASESEQARKARLQKMRQRAAKNLASESEQARKARLQDMRQRAAKYLASESEQARKARLQDMRQRAAKYLASESEQARKARLQDMRQRAAKYLASESEQARKARLQKMRQRAAKNSASDSEQV